MKAWMVVLGAMALLLGSMPAAAIAADDSLDVAHWGVEAFGNTEGVELRLMRLGPNGGAVGLYGGVADELVEGDDEVLTFGAIGRYDVIRDGNAPVGNLIPQALHWFTSLLGLPETTPVDVYVGVAIGGLYRTDRGDEDGQFDFAAQPLVGMTLGPLAGEIGYALGSNTLGSLSNDIDAAVQARLGLVFEF